MAKHAAPVLIMRVAGSGLTPVSQMDAELVDALPRGVDLEVTVKHLKRSLPQLRLYWAILAEIVKATGRFATAQHMSDEIKVCLGYVEKRVTFTGQPYYRADSIAFENMDAPVFKNYFDRAMELIAREMGIDPLATYEARRVA